MKKTLFNNAWLVQGTCYNMVALEQYVYWDARVKCYMDNAEIQSWTLKIAKSFGMEVISRMREKTGMTKQERLMGQNKESLISEEKQNKAK